MKRLVLILFLASTALTSCVTNQPEQAVEKPLHLPHTYQKFMQAITQNNVAKINSLLDFRCEFKQYPGMNGWYGFYRDNKLMIGPFPLTDYRKVSTLSLTRPAGYRENDYSRFHVFSQSYDLYFYFGPERVWIEGSGASGSKPAKMFVY